MYLLLNDCHMFPRCSTKIESLNGLTSKFELAMYVLLEYEHFRIKVVRDSLNLKRYRSR